MFIKKNLAFEQAAEQAKKCSLSGRESAWVDTYTSDEGDRSFSLDDRMHMFNLHNKVYVGQPFGKEVLDALMFYHLSSFGEDDLTDASLTVYWESNGGFLSAPYLFSGIGESQNAIFKDRPFLTVTFLYSGESFGGGAYALFCVPKENRKILSDARVNFFAERKPKNFKEDDTFNRHAELCISMADKFAAESKWTPEEMADMMKNIQSSYKYLYAVEGVPKTFFDFFIERFAENTGKSKEEAEKIMSEDRWWTAQELYDLGLFDEVIEADERIKKDLSYIRPASR